MKPLSSIICVSLLLVSLPAHAQSGVGYTNFLRQVQLPTNVVWDVVVPQTGEQLSPLAIDPGGARFELWTVRANPLTVYLLDTKYVGTYVPTAAVEVYSEDPNTYNAVPRTRADRPFVVDVVTSGLRTGDDAPLASKSVRLVRHVQSYGAKGDGTNVNRAQAVLESQVTLTNNSTHRLNYAINSVPGADRSKVRGEERFSVFSVADQQAPESQLASMALQVWPVADGSIAGISHDDTFRYALPQVTFSMNDLYPDSRTYAQVYKGELRSGVQGTAVPGTAVVLFEGAPQDRVLVVDKWDAVITDPGRWTLELLTVTPFGTDRLAAVSFTVDRTISVNGSVSTAE
jgi:hypothetical protein